MDLSRVLLGQGKLDGARRAISDAFPRIGTSRDPNLKLPLAIQDARIEAAEISRAQGTKSRPDFSSPQRKLLTAVSRAHHLGYYGIECDARLALAELEFRQEPRAARAHLAELAREAHARGINLIARKATALLNTSSQSLNLL